jgi:hypothetical protein
MLLSDMLLKVPVVAVKVVQSEPEICAIVAPRPEARLLLSWRAANAT